MRLSQKLQQTLLWINVESMQKKAKNLHITAKIYCEITYSSHGIFGDRIKGTIEGYEKFWCRIFTRIENENSPIFEISMDSAFDYTPAFWKENITAATLNGEKCHKSWWKRIRETSIDGSAFYEKVD